MSEKTAALAKQWLEWDYNPTTHAEIKKLVDEHNEAELAKRLYQRIDFGTAGASLFEACSPFPALMLPLFTVERPSDSVLSVLQVYVAQ